MHAYERDVEQPQALHGAVDVQFVLKLLHVEVLESQRQKEKVRAQAKGWTLLVVSLSSTCLHSAAVQRPRLLDLEVKSSFRETVDVCWGAIVPPISSSSHTSDSDRDSQGPVEVA
eukprot:768822-Hanusia_phi.AAC.9